MIQAHQPLNFPGYSIILSRHPKRPAQGLVRRDALMPISAHRALRTTARGLIAAFFLLAFGRAEAQAIIKVNDNVNFKLGLLLQTQWDEQQIANSTNTATGGWQQNMLLRRARIILSGQVAPNVFFFVETDNPNLGKTTCLLYTSDAADEEDSVDLGGRR